VKHESVSCKQIIVINKKIIQEESKILKIERHLFDEQPS